MCPQISVIVPVYNVEPYLSECVESLLSQNYSNVEIILVDDGSTDKSGIICDDYEKKYSQIKSIHQFNQGVSVARNNGMAIASGEYIHFMDPDDILDENTYSTVLPLLMENGADVVFFKFQNFGSNLIPNFERNVDVAAFFVLEGEERVSIPLRYSGSSCNCLYKKSILENQRFLPQYKLSEDTLFLATALMKSKKTIFVEQKFYYRRMRYNSASRTAFDERWRNVPAVIVAIKKELDKGGPEYADISNYVLYTKIIEMIAKLNYEYKKWQDDIRNIQKFLDKYQVGIIKSHYVSLKGKLMIMLYCITPELYYKVAGIYRALKNVSK